HATVYENYYGVPRQQVANALADGQHVLCRVDVQGAARLRKLLPEALFIFVMPPDKQALRVRLEHRAQDSTDTIERRLSAADEEIEQAEYFDYSIVNYDDRLDDAVRELIDVIETESRRDPPRIISV
ncbi:MAG: hypothetical protein QGH33_00460, partial [Pirellulaceae bacterium]|nr:hypothetical protein [Pirellulaceae bacterium]